MVKGPQRTSAPPGLRWPDGAGRSVPRALLHPVSPPPTAPALPVPLRDDAALCARVFWRRVIDCPGVLDREPEPARPEAVPGRDARNLKQKVSSASARASPRAAANPRPARTRDRALLLVCHMRIADWPTPTARPRGLHFCGPTVPRRSRSKNGAARHRTGRSVRRATRAFPSSTVARHRKRPGQI